ncbi:MAG: CheR family methyltransferase [Brevundimonas sp.]|nr:CheR family methyltransferase [Brevundimonas sp.]MDZ4061519.1 CheR family methyltransferase [Brevundimonas sp.]
MSPEDFDRLQALVATRTGNRLRRDRLNLAEHRLGPVARRAGFDSVDVMLAALWSKPVASLAWEIIEALLNGETWFRRDRATFRTMTEELLPALSQARPGRTLKIWSAGCSTGQEAWSLAMAALDLKLDVEVLGSDLNRIALEKAYQGAYTGFEIQRGLSAATMVRWFQPQGELWTASDPLKRVVRFERANLVDLSATSPDEDRFDVIFCRHVLTDMEPAARALVLEGLEQRLVDDGCLFLGADESLNGDSLAFRPVSGRRGLHVKSPTFLQRAA